MMPKWLYTQTNWHGLQFAKKKKNAFCCQLHSIWYWFCLRKLLQKPASLTYRFNPSCLCLFEPSSRPAGTLNPVERWLQSSSFLSKHGKWTKLRQLSVILWGSQQMCLHPEAWQKTLSCMSQNWIFQPVSFLQVMVLHCHVDTLIGSCFFQFSQANDPRPRYVMV